MRCFPASRYINKGLAGFEKHSQSGHRSLESHYTVAQSIWYSDDDGWLLLVHQSLRPCPFIYCRIVPGMFASKRHNGEIIFLFFTYRACWIIANKTCFWIISPMMKILFLANWLMKAVAMSARNHRHHQNRTASWSSKMAKLAFYDVHGSALLATTPASGSATAKICRQSN